MSDLSAITGTPVNSFGDLTEFFGNPDNYANSEYLQNVLLPYAKTNWKLFVLFLTILFFFVFLVLFIFIWVYMFVRPLCSCLYCIITKCICCCLCGKKKDEEKQSLLKNNVNSPVHSYSPGGSSPKKGSSPRAIVTASERINKLHQAELQKNKNGGKIVPPRRRCMCCVTTCPIICLIIMIVVIGFVFWKSNEMDTSVITLLDDTNDFTQATSDFLCTDDTPYWQCNANSMGQFTKNSKGIFNDISDEVVTFIDNFTGDLKTNLNNTALTLTDLLTEMDTIPQNLVDIADNMTALGKLYNDIPNVDDIDLPTIDTTMMNSYTGIVNTTLTMINSINSDLTGMLDSTLGSVKDMFTPGANDSVADMANTYLDQGIKYIYDAQNYTVFAEKVMSLIIQDDASFSSLEEVQVGSVGPIEFIDMLPAQTQEYVSNMSVNEALRNKTYALCIIFIVPAFFLLTTILFNFCCFKRGCRVQLCCHMCVNFIFFFFVFLVTFLWSYFGVMMQITCDYHDDVIALIPQTNYSFELNGDTIDLQVSSQLVNNLLTCTDENKENTFQYSDTDNFISILGLTDDLALVNNTLQSYRSNITNMLDALPTSMIDDAEDQMKSINVTAIFEEVSGYIEITKEITTNLTDIKDALPTNESIDILSIRQEWDDFFFSHTFPTFWSNYSQQLDEVNLLLNHATLQDGLTRNFTFESMLTTPKKAFGTASCYCEDVPGLFTCTTPSGGACSDAADYSSASGYAVLYGKIEALKNLTLAFNMTVEIKDELYANLTSMETYANNIYSSLLKVNDTLDTIGDYIVDLGGEVTSFVATIDSIAPGIDGVIDEVMQLVSLVADLPAYTKCYFVGDFYENAFQGVVCQEFTPALIWGSWTMFLFMFVLMFSFIVSSCCLRARHIPEEELEDESEEDEEDDIDDSEDGVQMTNTIVLKSNGGRPVSLAQV